jgi:hypothetical protein
MEFLTPISRKYKFWTGKNNWGFNIQPGTGTAM